MMRLSATEITKSFGQTVALRNVSLAVAPGEFLCVLGPTNAGKTTLLKTIAGLHFPDRGTIAINDREVTLWEPARRNVSLLFQSVALFPHRTGFENLAFPLRLKHVGETEIKNRVYRTAELLRITAVLDRLPKTFSGGERQRVALGRAVIQPANLLLLDEPLANLDARIRHELRQEFRRLHRAEGQTTIYVTHDHVEALSLGDRIAVLRQGMIRQIGSPESIYEHPADNFVAEYVGAPRINLFPAKLQADHRSLTLIGADVTLPLPSDFPVKLPGEEVLIGIRPESVAVGDRAVAETPWSAQLRSVEYLGHRLLLHAQRDRILVRALVPADQARRAGDQIWLGFSVANGMVFDRTGLCLGTTRDWSLTTRENRQLSVAPS
jgi:ABC-type sugar transport system ATPase subunit